MCDASPVDGVMQNFARENDKGSMVVWAKEGGLVQTISSKTNSGR